MTGSDWLATLQQRVEDASKRLTSSTAGLLGHRARIARQLDAVVERVGFNELKRDQATDNELHQAVVHAFTSGRYDHLSMRQQRYAAKRFELAPPQAMQGLLVNFPSNWPTFIKECFRRWDALSNVDDRAGYTRLLCLSPDGVPFTIRGRTKDLVQPEAATYVAKQLAAQDLPTVRQELERYGFHHTWAFTSIALAIWTWKRDRAKDSFDSLFAPLAHDIVTETMLLPAVRDGASATSWFSQNRRPLTLRNALYAHALFVATLLRSSTRGADATNLARFTEHLLRSEFGDPRVPPESKGWQEVKRLDPTLYKTFLEQLISEDLEVFFAHAMNDPRRRKFWLRYLGSVRRTACVLDQHTHERLSKQLGGADKKLAAALGRARMFVRRGRVHAFCLYFDRHVVVEFSDTGNAAFVYDRSDFERRYEAAMHSNRLASHDALKNEMKEDRLLHQGPWENRASEQLKVFGIYQD